MYQAMYEYPTAFGFVIEGYPRDVPQAQDFERTVSDTEYCRVTVSMTLVSDRSNRFGIADRLHRTVLYEHFATAYRRTR